MVAGTETSRPLAFRRLPGVAGHPGAAAGLCYTYGMNVATTALLSASGVAAAIALLAGAAAWLALRGRSRIVLAGSALLGAVALAAAAVASATPRVEAARLQAAGDASLLLAAQELSDGYNAEAWAALDRAEGEFRALGLRGGRNAAAARAGLARVEAGRGDVERLQGRLDEARTRYTNAAVRLNALSHPDVGWALLRLGHVELALDNTAAARAAYAQAIPVFARLGMTRGEAEAHLADGAIARRAGAFGDAIGHLQAGLRLFGEDLVGAGRVLVELAWVAQAQRLNAEALAQMSAAEELFRRADVPMGRAGPVRGRRDRHRGRRGGSGSRPSRPLPGSVGQHERSAGGCGTLPWLVADLRAALACCVRC